MPLFKNQKVSRKTQIRVFEAEIKLDMKIIVALIGGIQMTRMIRIGHLQTT
jgi:hypothetical protein